MRGGRPRLAPVTARRQRSPGPTNATTAADITLATVILVGPEKVAPAPRRCAQFVSKELRLPKPSANLLAPSGDEPPEPVLNGRRQALAPAAWPGSDARTAPPRRPQMAVVLLPVAGPPPPRAGSDRALRHSLGARRFERNAAPIGAMLSVRHPRARQRCYRAGEGRVLIGGRFRPA
jgi:hypothetical protein